MLFVLMLSALSLTACGFEIVETGSSGVKKTMGKVEPESLPAGFYTYNPFITTIYEIDNQTQRFDGKTSVYTRDVQQANIALAINYNLDPKYTVKMFSEVGIPYEDKLIPQVVNGALKNVIGKWNAIDLIANRQKATTEIQDSIAGSLGKAGLIVTQVELTDVAFATQFENAVEAKVVAVQRAEEARNKTVEIEENAKQRIIAAKADAEAMQIKTEALSKSQSLVAYEAVQKWNGVLPKIIGGNGANMLNIPAGILEDK